jgi:hypothetical protein
MISLSTKVTVTTFSGRRDPVIQHRIVVCLTPRSRLIAAINHPLDRRYSMSCCTSLKLHYGTAGLRLLRAS